MSTTIKKPQKYKFIGHITYKNTPKAQSAFFRKHSQKRYNVELKGEAILTKCVLSNDTVKVLKQTGYTVTPNNKIGTVTVNNINGVRINASIDTANNNILIRVVAKSSMELTDNVRSVINTIKNEIGIVGEADVYTTMEMC
jgi:hypothetical protein